MGTVFQINSARYIAIEKFIRNLHVTYKGIKLVTIVHNNGTDYIELVLIDRTVKADYNKYIENIKEITKGYTNKNFVIGIELSGTGIKSVKAEIIEEQENSDMSVVRDVLSKISGNSISKLVLNNKVLGFRVKYYDEESDKYIYHDFSKDNVQSEDIKKYLNMVHAKLDSEELLEKIVTDSKGNKTRVLQTQSEYDGTVTVSELKNIAIVDKMLRSFMEDRRYIVDKSQQDNKPTVNLDSLLFNAIIAWYDDSYTEYKGIDDEDFVDHVCDTLGITESEYNAIVKTGNKLQADNSRIKSLIHNAIIAWYDDSYTEYRGLDDEEFVDRVCNTLDITMEVYKDLMR